MTLALALRQICCDEAMPSAGRSFNVGRSTLSSSSFIRQPATTKSRLGWRGGKPNVRFSNRPVWVKRFQTIHCCSVDVARGLVLLSGIGSWALPSWGSRTGWTNLLGGLAVGLTVGPADIAISPHPSSREGHHATAWWSSRFSYRVWLYTALTLQRRFCSSGTRCHQPRCGA